VNGYGNGGGNGRGTRDDGGDPLGRVNDLGELALIAAFSVIGGALFTEAIRRIGGASATWGPTIAIPAAAIVMSLWEGQAEIAAGWFAIGATAGCVVRMYLAYQYGGGVWERERRRIGPAQLVRRSLRLLRRRNNRLRGDRLAFGQTRDRRLVEVPFGASYGMHGLLIGATGGGKTTDARSYCQAHIRVRNSVVVADAKGDDALEATLRDEAERAGVPFYLWTPHGPSTYNVAARGGASEVADKLLSAHQWSEPHYLSVALRYCQREVQILRECGIEPSLASIARYMHPARLEAVAADHGTETVERVRELTSDIPKRMAEDLAGARSRIAMLAEAEFAPWLMPSRNGRPEIDLADVIRHGGVAYFRLEADRHPQLGAILAAALIVDLVALSAELQGGVLRGLLFIDEFAAIGADQVSRLFATARSAGLSTLLATQGLADMRAARDEGLADTLTAQVIQNVSYVIAHRVSDPVAAETLAQMAGTYETWKLTQEVGGEFLPARTGSGSRIPTERFRMHPNEFKSLRTGEAIVIENGRSAERCWVWSPME
jgi:hypothetical protein